MLLAHQIPRVSIAQLSAQYKPRKFRALSAIEIVVGGHVTEVQLLTTSGDGCITGTRRWLRCNHCARAANVLGFVAGFGWACRRCLGWRSRGRPGVTAPPASEEGPPCQASRD